MQPEDGGKGWGCGGGPNECVGAQGGQGRARGPKVTHEARRGAQGASRVVPGKSGVYACDEEEPINALESW